MEHGLDFRSTSGEFLFRTNPVSKSYCTPNLNFILIMKSNKLFIICKLFIRNLKKKIQFRFYI